MSALRSFQVLVLFAVAAVIGCGGRGVSYAPGAKPAHPITQIKKGMTEQEVIAVLGEPTKRGKFLEYINDPIKTANKEQILYWETPQLGNLQVQMKAGLVHGWLKK